MRSAHKKRKIILALAPSPCYLKAMKEKEQAKPTQDFSTLEATIATIKANREAEAKAHAETMKMLATLKAGSIFAK